MKMKLGIGLLLAALLAACVPNAARIDRLAAAGNLSRELVSGTDFEHVIFSNALVNGLAPRRVYLYIEGDGRPWGDTGLTPAADPTTRNPLALRLLLQTPAPAAYISRPCYQGLSSAACQPALWTLARYSEEVVATMTRAITTWAERYRIRELVLVGYSGGGTLAVLIGERLPMTAAVITLAANLDIETWVRTRGFLQSLDASLNPASSTQAHPWPELHLFGEQDEAVPPATTAAYFERFTHARRRGFAGYGHVCCWVENWRATFAAIEAELPNP